MNEATAINILPICKGMVFDIRDVPDPAFAEKMLGDGFAIDLFESVIRAPISGRIKTIYPTNHAIIIDTNLGFDVLIHIGLDTVKLNSIGFNVLTSINAEVNVGDPLIEVDLDYLALHARSLLTPVIFIPHESLTANYQTKFTFNVTLAQKNININLDKSSNNLESNKIHHRYICDDLSIALGIVELIIDHNLNHLSSNQSTFNLIGDYIFSDEIVIYEKHGIHARPASAIMNLAKQFVSNIQIVKLDHNNSTLIDASLNKQSLNTQKIANAKSITSILMLNILCNDKIKVIASGADAQDGINAISHLLQHSLGQTHNYQANQEQLINQTTLIHQGYNNLEFTDCNNIGFPNSNTIKNTNRHHFVDNRSCRGVVASHGIAYAKSVVIGQQELEFAENSHFSDYRQELTRFETILSKTRDKLSREIDQLLDKDNNKLGGGLDLSTEAEIMQAHLALLNDQELIQSTHNIIAEHKTTEFAWSKSIDYVVNTLYGSGSQILIERINDLLDIKLRLLNEIYIDSYQQQKDHSINQNQQNLAIQKTIQEKISINNLSQYGITNDQEVILIANEFSPSQIIALPKNVKGLVSIHGGATSHVAILAKMRSIPLLINVDPSVVTIVEQINWQSMQKMILDLSDNSDYGVFIYSPNIDECQSIQEKIELHQRFTYSAMMDAAYDAKTSDGVQVKCYANIAGVDDIDAMNMQGADGVGLFRTEFIYMNSNMQPSIDEQIEIYQQINQKLQQKKFTIRVLDIGGDKQVSYLPQEHEYNPALGVRGVRFLLSQQGIQLFHDQLTAIISVAYKHNASSNIEILLPMISTIEEYRQIKSIVSSIIAENNFTIIQDDVDDFDTENGIKDYNISKIRLGIMIETPAAIFLSEIFAQEVDFISIGTNDLSQYIMAIDREHAQISQQIDYLHPAILNAIALIARAAKKYNKPISVCGVMASDILAIIVLLGLDIDLLSMNIDSIAKNKYFIRKLNVEQCRAIANHCLQLATADEVRKYLEESSEYQAVKL